MPICTLSLRMQELVADPERTGKMIHIPQRQRFDTDNLRHIFATLSRNEKLLYSAP
jgi:hypothetical protein